MAAEPGNDRRIDCMVKPVRLGLVREEHAQYGDEDCASGQQSTSPRTGGGGQQWPAEP